MNLVSLACVIGLDIVRASSILLVLWKVIAVIVSCRAVIVFTMMHSVKIIEFILVPGVVDMILLYGIMVKKSR